MASGLDGVQLPEDGAPAIDVRRVWPAARIGVSRHDLAGLEHRSEGADFALVAPVLATASKPGVEPMGIAGFGALAALREALDSGAASSPDHQFVTGPDGRVGPE